jgi:group I intron endonuclease
MNTNKSNKKVSGIYKIVNIIDGKYYIGSSDNILGTSGRWKEHMNDLIANRHCNSYLQRAWNKYGLNSFKLIIVEKVPKKDLLIIEQKYLDIAKPEYHKKTYNLSFFAAGGGGFFGHKHSKKSKLQTSKKLKGRISPNKGKTLSWMTGENHHGFNHTIYTFKNTYTNEIFTGKRYNFIKKYNLSAPPIKNLTRGKSKISQGWIIDKN